MADVDDSESTVNWSELKTVAFYELKTGVSYKDKVLKGMVSNKWNIKRAGRKSLLKIEIKEEISHQETVNVFLLGVFAEKCQNIAIQDPIKITNFHVEKNTSKGSSGFQVIVDSFRNDATIWVEMAADRVSLNQKEPITNKRSYNYTLLNDVLPDSIVNVYGVVKFFKEPIKSKGEDYFSVISIVDPSITDLDRRLSCTIFAPSKSKLPQVNAVGDIVRFHRLKVKTYKEAPQGLSSPGFSALVFDGKDSDSFIPRTVNSSYTLTEVDKEKVTELREWIASQDNSTLLESNIIRLVDCVIGHYFDLVCQVVATAIVEPGVSALLRVWDGTIVQSPVHELDSEAEGIELNVDHDLFLKTQGYMVDIFVYDDHCSKALEVKPGDYVHLGNLHAMKHKNLQGDEHSAVPTIEFSLHKGNSFGRRLVILNKDDPEVNTLKLLLDSAQIVNDTISQQEPMEGTSRFSVQQDDKTTKQSSSKNYTFKKTATLSTDPESKTCSSGTDASDVHIRDLKIQASPAKIARVHAHSGNTPEDRCLLRTATVIKGHTHIAFSTIDEVLKHEVPYKFKVRVKVIKYIPKVSDSHAFVKLHCSCCHFLSEIPKHCEDRAEESSPEENVFVIPCIDDNTMIWKEVFFTFKGRKCRAQKLIEYKKQKLKDAPLYIPDLTDLELLELKKMGHRVVVVRKIETDEWCRKAVPTHTFNSVPYYECPVCKENPTSPMQIESEETTDGQSNGVPLLEYIYMMKLLLSDDTNFITTLLWRNEAERFFLDIAACDLIANSGDNNFRTILQYLDQLCPADKQEPIPWMECCIMSYTTHSGTSYQLFDTELSIV